MSRSVNLAKEALELALVEDDGLFRQYCSRFPIPLARRFVADCISENLQPSTNLKLITTLWFEYQDEGVAYRLTAEQMKDIDLVASAHGVGRPEIAKIALMRILPTLVREATERLRDRNSALREFRDSVDDSPEGDQ